MEQSKSTIRTGRDLIMASLPYAKEDKSKSWQQVGLTIALLIISFLGAISPYHWGFRIMPGLLFALVMVRFFILYHDFNHHSILKNSKSGKVIMTLFGIFILAPITIWKRTHDYHHKNNSKLSNNGVGSYPLINKKDFYRLSKKKRFIYLTSRHPATILLGYISLFIFDFNIKTFILNPKKHWDAIITLFFHFSVATLLFSYGGISTLLVSWVGPFMISNAIGSYLFYAQHNFPEAQYVQNKDWDYVRASLASTSFLKMGRIMNWFTGNIGYHHIHHLNHHIPFYRLREAMDGIPEMQQPFITSFHPKDIFACLKLKVWDPELNKMSAL